MKKLLILFLLLPGFLLSQTERDEKISKKNLNYKQTEKSSDNNINYNWRRWGTPYTYPIHVYERPAIYYNRHGIYQPNRIYRLSDGQPHIIRETPYTYRFGLSYGYPSNFGGWLTVGKKYYLISEYTGIVTNDESTFMYNVTYSDVLRWGDERLDDITYGGAIYAGPGITFSNLSGYFMAGYAWETRNLQFYDELYILSNNGRYSIRDYDKNFITGKLGIIYDYKYLTVKTDYDFIRNIINLGCGVTFSIF